MNQIAAQLRSVKHRNGAGGFSVDQQRVAKRALLSAIGGELHEEQTSTLRAKYFVWLSHSFISRPVAIGVAGFVLAGSGLMTTVSAAEASLPGDVLYSVKLINERAQIQLASLDRRAVLHTEFAQRRLREVEQLQLNSSTRNTSLVTDTMNAYTQEVASANQNLRELQASGDESTVAVANEVDQNLSTLNTSIANATVPLTSTEGSVATSTALSTTQVAQEDVVTVAVEANNQDAAQTSKQDLQSMFMRQFGAIATRKAFDLRRISVIRASLLAHVPELRGLDVVTADDLSRLERSINIAFADVGAAMDTFAIGGYRSAFETLQRTDTVLRGIEATIADAETAITEALMAKSAEDPASMGSPISPSSLTPSDANGSPGSETLE